MLRLLPRMYHAMNTAVEIKRDSKGGEKVVVDQTRQKSNIDALRRGCMRSMIYILKNTEGEKHQFHKRLQMRLLRL